MNKFQTSNGFTLIEVTAVIFIISIGLVGVLSLVLQNIKAGYINKNTLIASQLAQEGLELVRNLRDENWLTAGSDWKESIVADGTYAIDYTGRGSINDGVNSISDAAAILKINTDGFYNHSGGTAGNFSRLISVADFVDFITVSSVARWEDKGNYYNYKAETVLYNWK